MLTDVEKDRISSLVSALEKRSGTQIVTAFTERSDHYPEIPWKAFALGVALAAAILMLVSALLTDRAALPLLLAVVLCLCGGLGLLLLSLMTPAFARLFLDHIRAEAEARQYADGLFLQHELFAAPARRAVLMLVTRFERSVVILPDHGLQETLTPPVLDRIAAAMSARLMRGEVAAAFEAGLAALEPHLGAPVAGVTAAGKPLADQPIVISEP